MSNLKRDIEGVLSKYIPPDNLSGYVTTDCDCYEKARMVHGAKLTSVTCEHQKVNLKDYTPTLEQATTQIINLIEAVLPKDEPYPRPAGEKDYEFDNPRHRYAQGLWVGHTMVVADIKSKLIGKE